MQLLSYAVLITALVFGIDRINAQTTENIDVSAYIVDVNNEEIPNGDYEVRFALYTTDRAERSLDPDDSQVWQETQTVMIYNGLLKAYLGEINSFPTTVDFAAQQYFLGIRIGEDDEMVPRKRVGAVPLALDAMNAATAANALSLNGATVGSGAGNIPVLNASGKLDSSLITVDTIDTSDFVLDDDDRLHDQNTDTGTSKKTFILGKGVNLNNNFTLSVSKKSGRPALRYNGSQDRWEFSNDGSTYQALESGAAGSYLSLSGGTMAGNIVFAPAQTVSASIISGTLGVSAGGTGLASYISGDMLYYSSGDTLTALGIGSDGQVLKSLSGVPVWGTPVASSAHNLLSLTHTDTTADNVLQGDLITGQDSGGGVMKWQRLAVGNSGQFLGTDGTDITWNDTTSITQLGTITTGVWNGTAVDDSHVANDLTLAGGTIGTSAITLVQSITPTPIAEGVMEWDTDNDRIV
ncbi:MAG: hypothetical protein U9M90_01470, partial [Patescibacteria group bacterium]|nr:hypothetical protein [Patescibacteria group bacterium]